MIISVYGEKNSLNHPKLTEIFKARASVFDERLGWQVKVENGLEVDHYDRDHNPTYIALLNDETGQLDASLRLLPTSGPMMMNQEFKDFFKTDIKFNDPKIWECTRFCTHPHADGEGGDPHAASKLLEGLAEYSLAHGIQNIIGIYDLRMQRIYRRLGWEPNILAENRSGPLPLRYGIWDVLQDTPQDIRSKRD